MCFGELNIRRRMPILAFGPPIAVQAKLTWHADIRTTTNTYGGVVTGAMIRAASKVATQATNGAEPARKVD